MFDTIDMVANYLRKPLAPKGYAGPIRRAKLVKSLHFNKLSRTARRDVRDWTISNNVAPNQWAHWADSVVSLQVTTVEDWMNEFRKAINDTSSNIRKDPAEDTPRTACNRLVRCTYNIHITLYCKSLWFEQWKHKSIVMYSSAVNDCNSVQLDQWSTELRTKCRVVLQYDCHCWEYWLTAIKFINILIKSNRNDWIIKFFPFSTRLLIIE